MKDKLGQNICRVIKIEKEALYEFIYENFIRGQEDILNVSSVECMNNFAINWENGEFIFIAHKDEGTEGNIVPFPNDIDIKKVLEKIPKTTDSVLSSGKKYKDYSFDELRELIKS